MTSTDQWLDQYKHKVEGMKRAAVELEDNLAAATVTTSSPDGSVTVTVGANGSLRDLRFSHRAAEHSHAELAGLVMKTVAKAQRAVSEQVVEAFQPLGAGTAAMELLTQFVPDEPADADDGPSAYTDLAAGAPPQPPAPVMPPPAPIPPVTPPAPVPPAPRAAAPAAGPRRSRAADVEDDEYEERPW
jgi:DNA-binding protein YbaB